ncbi:sensor histidine kinase [Micromonospora sp. NPDC049559]|uniref:sensor histidine kinase n=1 Tax=Micromonospora sp. NPDC049559 TaxID=3155923 RepID=UPI00343AFC4A
MLDGGTGQRMTGAPGGRSTAKSLRHQALLYSGDHDYLRGIRDFVDAGIAAGQPALIAVPPHRLDLLREAYAASPDVRLVDIGDVGRNPARILPGLLFPYLAEQAGRPARIVSEPIWSGRPVAAYPRCVQHEALTNIALADEAVSVLCPYEATALGADVIADAASTHPVLIRDGDARSSPGYGRPESVVDAFNRPLPEPTFPPSTLLFDAAGLSGMRALVAALAEEAGLKPERVGELQLAVNEIATNAVTHSPREPAVLRVWADPDGMVCEVIGSSVLTDRLAGLVPPSPTSDRGRGLFLVNYLCDLVHVHTDDRSTTVRVHMGW